NGTGDVVGPQFDPPPPLIWRIEYRGTGNFIVWRRCRDGDDLVQNAIGALALSRPVRFGAGPCFWEVQASGDWSLVPTAEPAPAPATPTTATTPAPASTPPAAAAMPATSAA